MYMGIDSDGVIENKNTIGRIEEVEPEEENIVNTTHKRLLYRGSVSMWSG